MTLSKTLNRKTKIDEAELIAKGGSSGQEGPAKVEDEQMVKRVNLRIPAKYLQRVDQSLSNRLGNVSRNTWIIEAIVEKLGKEQNGAELDAASSQTLV